MSFASTSDLLEENRKMKQIFAQIHSMTAPFVDLNANVTPTTVKVVEKVSTIQRKRSISKIEQKTSTSVPKQNAHENAAKRQRHPKRSVLSKDNSINASASGAMNSIRLSTSSAITGITQSPPGPMNTNTLSTAVATSEKRPSADDLMFYLRLKQVVPEEQAQPQPESSNSSAPKSNGTSVKIDPNSKKRPLVDLSTRVKVMIDRLTPAQIAHATGQTFVAVKRLKNQQAYRRNSRRRAAPTNLKDISVLDLLKD